ncbi:hypothetical protein MBGDN05_00446 [Thermoplasmatales archaeon SCGC AB-539-N05]|nr:hypothetical protein MBGDN05_00446 [Thermoplasmatales archaeon SCGC AB-539-N05]
MKITIITEDSGVKLPKIDRYRGTIGRGFKLSEHRELNNILKKNKISIPSDDIEKEEFYKKKLDDFVRPAKLMFAGMFSEVRVFYEDLKKNYDIDLFITSGRYGLINCELKIVPYDFHLKDHELIVELDKKTCFFNKIIEVTKSSDFVIILLNSNISSYLFDKHILEKLNNDAKSIFVCSSEFKDKIIESGNIFLQKTGVARIAEINRKSIKELFGGKNG